jgi:hypothetical protein
MEKCTQGQPCFGFYLADYKSRTVNPAIWDNTYCSIGEVTEFVTESRVHVSYIL